MEDNNSDLEYLSPTMLPYLEAIGTIIQRLKKLQLQTINHSLQEPITAFLHKLSCLVLEIQSNKPVNDKAFNQIQIYFGLFLQYITADFIESYDNCLKYIETLRKRQISQLLFFFDSILPLILSGLVPVLQFCSYFGSEKVFKGLVMAVSVMSFILCLFNKCTTREYASNNTLRERILFSIFFGNILTPQQIESAILIRGFNDLENIHNQFQQNGLYEFKKNLFL